MHDLRLAVRSLRATPAVTAIALASLALGIGANSAIFSLLSALLLRPLPVAEPDRLVTITTQTAVDRHLIWSWNYPTWDEVRRRPDLFESVAAWGAERFDLASGGPAQLVDALWVSGSFFSTLGISPAAGRLIDAEDDRRGGGRDGAVAVVSDAFAERQFGRRRDALGRSVMLNRVRVTIVGVVPSAFHGPEVGRTFDVMVPLGVEPLIRRRESRLDQRGDGWLMLVARLRRDQTVEGATLGLRRVQRQIWEATLWRNMQPAFLAEYLNQSFALLPAAAGSSVLRRQYQEPVIAIQIAAAMVLLIACANIATLLVGRMLTRQHEWSVRVALGASRWRIVRSVLVESAVLAVTGAACGVVLAVWASRLIVRQLSTPDAAVFLDLSVDWRILGFTMAVAAGTAIIAGVVPAYTMSRTAPDAALRSSPFQSTGGGGWSGLIVAQLALSLTLVVAAGLFVRTFTALVSRPLGFERDRTLLVGIDSQRTQIAPAQRAQIYERVRQAVRAMPSVSDAALSMVTPIDSTLALVVRAEIAGGATVSSGPMLQNSFTNLVSPGWFRTFGIPLVNGRDFTEADSADAPRVAIINETMARQFLGEESPIGRQLTFTLPGRRVSMDIVGVAADAIYSSPREIIPATVYTPIAQLYLSPIVITSINLAVRTPAGSPEALSKAVTNAIGTVNPELSLTFRPIAEQVYASMRSERLMAELAAFFGVLALLLAALGLYGVIAAMVARRRREFGIRIALGATPSAIVRLVTARIAGLVTAGAAIGTLVSLWASRFVATLLYGLGPQDPTTLGLALLLLAFVAVAAGWWPARHASATDPADVLRSI